MTRAELAQKVGRLTKSPTLGAKLAYGSWGTILKPAAFTGRLCFGPSLGQHVRFTRPTSWATLSSAIDVAEATAMVTRRFLAAYGPATYHDLARWWGGGGIATARQWLAALGDEVSAVELDGEKAWMLAADACEARELPALRSVRLLPAFDQYVIGASRHAEHLLAADVRSRVYRPQGWISPVLLVDGFMQGVWRHALKGSRLEVLISPFINIPLRVRRAAEDEAERLAGFFGAKLCLSWQP